MISFSEFIKQNQITLPTSVLSWDGSFATMRNNIKLQPSWPDSADKIQPQDDEEHQQHKPGDL